MPSHPRIAIVGGGPAGLTLGVLLYKHGIPFTIFELRQQPTEEELAKPSGMLDLHAESGIAAIKECGLYDHFIPLTRECADVFIVADRNGNILATNTSDGTRPEISRHNLTKLLLDNIPAESIKWHHKLLSATKSATPGDTETELDFGTQGKYTFDLVIGADGAWSKVRQLLTNTRPQYSGTLNITLTIKDITKKYPHLANLLDSGSFTSLGNRHVIVSQRGPMDSARVYLWLTHPDENFATSYGLAGKPATNAKDKLLSDDTLLGTFGATMKELVAAACDEETVDNPGRSLDIRGLYKLPHGSSWEHKAGVTLIGDAASLMLPNGEGVNIAMHNSLLLSHAIIKAYETARNDTKLFQSTFDPLLNEFETALVDRAKQAGDETDALLGVMFGSDDAAHDMASLFQSAAQAQQR